VRPEAMLEGFMKLQDKIRKEKKGLLTEEMV
jgi:NADH:ubiquinone oxidoreductase subunit B-like Fe-S oxidoreductase